MTDSDAKLLSCSFISLQLCFTFCFKNIVTYGDLCRKPFLAAIFQYCGLKIHEARMGNRDFNMVFLWWSIRLCKILRILFTVILDPSGVNTALQVSPHPNLRSLVSKSAKSWFYQISFFRRNEQFITKHVFLRSDDN